MTNTRGSRRGVAHRRVVMWSVRAVCHLIGAAVVYGLTLWAMSSTVSWVDLHRTATLTDFWSANALALLGQAVISALVWASVVVGAHSLRRVGRRRPAKLLARARGTVMTETLIILPVMLMLISGVAQITVNCMAGILTSVAAYEAGRTAWVWEPEARVSRMDYDGGDIRERARVSAATVLAPVAPSDHRVACAGGQSAVFEARMRAMLATAVSALNDPLAMAITPSSVGSYVNGQYARRMGQGKSGLDLTFYEAVDTMTFSMRGPIKLYQAYCSTQATWSGTGSDPVTSSVTYAQKQVFPFVGWLWGGPRAAIGDGYYLDIEREYSLPAQVSPNYTPPANLLAALHAANPLSNLFSF